MRLVVYTTKYRKGGDLFARAALTLTRQWAATPDEDIMCVATETKQALRKVLFDIKEAGKRIHDFHFIGHSGMYGPMFGTIAFPEQFSPWEWKQLDIPFTSDAVASFHCCRSARWFAPFFSDTFNVKSCGYHWYTTFSASPVKYKPVDLFGKTPEVYCIGCPGKKSHGWIGSFKKLTGLSPAETLRCFEPQSVKADETYNSVAELYAEVFRDIKVREDEWTWLQQHLPKSPGYRALDIGCGNGALLSELSPLIASGIGVDESSSMIELAARIHQDKKNLSFASIDGPILPLPDHSVDIVISLLSFRYLDWDPMMEEIKRVLAPGGRFLVIDMVTVPVSLRELPRMLIDKYRAYRQGRRNPEFFKALNRLVSDPHWAEMLRHNPIRAQHEYVWYLQSRFPGSKAEILNIGYHSRILAFDSGDIAGLQSTKLTYP